MYNEEEMLLDMGYIKAERCIAKPVPFGKYNSTEYASYYCHCPNCKSDIVRRFMKNNTYLKGKTYKEFCKNCGQLLEIPYV